METLDQDQNPEPETKTKRFREHHAELMLGLVSFAESSFLPIIADPFVIGTTLMKTHKWARYALITTVASVLGGLFGYLVGYVAFDIIGAKLITFYHLEHFFDFLTNSFNANAFLFTLLGAFTPIPYKLVAIVGGFTRIHLAAFVLASILGRGVRFFLVAYITRKFGERTMHRFAHSFNLITAGVVLITLLYVVAVFIGLA